MTRLNFSKLIGSAATVVCLLSITGQQAQAGELHNGWNYAQDSFSDGTGGGGAFEFYGIAMTETDNDVIFAVNANLGIDGKNYSNATGGVVGWGDLMLNFSGSDTFDTATDLYGIRFAENNDSGVTELGLYENITTKSVAGTNLGWGSLNSYNNYLTSQGRTPSLADLNAQAQLPDSEINYFDTSTGVHNVIDSGNKIADITFIDDFKSAEYSGLGLDFEHINATGTYTFGFKVDKSFLPSGDFLAHLFAECNNDGMALVGNIEQVIAEAEKVPEPTAMAGLAMVGLGFLSRRRRKDCDAQ